MHIVGLYKIVFVYFVSVNMSTTTRAYRVFVSEPLSDKDVTALPGIGPVIGKQLRERGFSKVCIASYILN